MASGGSVVVKQLLKMAKKKGYISHDEVIERVPDDAEREELLEKLDELGIEVTDMPDEAPVEAAQPAPAAEAPAAEAPAPEEEEEEAPADESAEAPSTPPAAEEEEEEEEAPAAPAPSGDDGFDRPGGGEDGVAIGPDTG